MPLQPVYILFNKKHYKLNFRPSSITFLTVYLCRIMYLRKRVFFMYNDKKNSFSFRNFTTIRLDNLKF